ncbi:YciI family protein [Streptomyces bobili]|uniref:YciI family protein n=1 Tax=Streptomyces bobili TaxID=67280 RepID=UPI0036F925FA
MFILELSYTAPLDAVDVVLPDHVAWIEEQYARGLFLASGPKNPRDGGVIVAAAEDRARIEELTAGDPFVLAGVCAYRITEFEATKTATELERHRVRPG